MLRCFAINLTADKISLLRFHNATRSTGMAMHRLKLLDTDLTIDLTHGQDGSFAPMNSLVGLSRLVNGPKSLRLKALRSLAAGRHW